MDLETLINKHKIKTCTTNLDGVIADQLKIKPKTHQAFIRETQLHSTLDALIVKYLSKSLDDNSDSKQEPKSKKQLLVLEVSDCALRLVLSTEFMIHSQR